MTPPLVNNVLFTLWRSLEAGMDFGYHEPLHAIARSRSREGNWFAEFEGTWDGSDPLAFPT